MIRKTFQHDDEKYDIRDRLDGTDIRICAYRGNRPANNIEYVVSVEDQSDLIRVAGIDMVDAFVQMAERDVKNPPRPIPMV